MSELIVGLMAGTSADGVDAVLVNFDSNESPQILSRHFHPYPAYLRQQILSVTHSDSMVFDEFFTLDKSIAEEFSVATLELLDKQNCSRGMITAIGSHGQTVRHRPEQPDQYTVQIGDPNILSARTQIDVISDFRRADMAKGGQGAPLAPLFHDHFFRIEDASTVVLNLGGIANISILNPGEPVRGFDTGPANAFMDYWIEKCQGITFDDQGLWAASGSVNKELLLRMLADDYFSLAPPKSTGREYFNDTWLANKLAKRSILEADVQSTLCELTAVTVSDAINKICPDCDKLFVCGGGSKNSELLRRIQQKLPETHLSNPASIGLDADFLEATVFAWLAKRYLNNHPLKLNSITGGPDRAILGCMYKAVK